MNSVISSRTHLPYQLPLSLDYLAKSRKTEALSITSDKLKERGAEIGCRKYSPKSETMFNRGSKPGNLGGMGDQASNPGFQGNQAPSSSYLGFAGNQGLQSALQQQAQSQALVAQQQLLLQITNNKSRQEVHQIASNIQESLLIKKRLQEITSMESMQQLQRQEASKLRADLQIKAAAQQAGIGVRGNASLLGSAKPIPSTSNTGVVPTKQREDEMTKPDLSTLAETAVAVASAVNVSRARNSTGMLGRLTKPTDLTNTSGNDQIAAVLGRRNSSAGTKESSQPGISNSLNSAVTDMLRRDLNATREKLQLQQSYKRSLDEMTKSDTVPAPSSWLLKSATNLQSTTTMEQLRAHHEHLQQRRNSLPARATSIASEFPPLRTLKRQRLLEQKASEIERLELHDAMERMRQMDPGGSGIRLPGGNSLLAELSSMASKVASQERRASITSSVASVGTTGMSSTLTSPVNERSITNLLETNLDERARVLDKLSKLQGGFPMPKTAITKSATNIAAPIPAEITPEAGKDIIDFARRRSLSSRDNLSAQQARLGGFPMPPLYKRSDENQMANNSMALNTSGTRINNAVSSHIRKNVGGSTLHVAKPPALESYKRVWREIDVIVGDDPALDERLRREVFARRLQRGDVFVGRTTVPNTAINNNTNRFVNNSVQQQRQQSGASGNRSGRTNGDSNAEETSIII